MSPEERSELAAAEAGVERAAPERSVLGPECHDESGRFIGCCDSVVTCRLQRRSLFAYLTNVLTANIRGDPIPALA